MSILEAVTKLDMRRKILSNAREAYIGMRYRDNDLNVPITFTISTTGIKRCSESIKITNPELAAKLIDIIEEQADYNLHEDKALQEKEQMLSKLESAL